jgi:glucuronate isomerase
MTAFDCSVLGMIDNTTAMIVVMTLATRTGLSTTSRLFLAFPTHDVLRRHQCRKKKQHKK